MMVSNLVNEYVITCIALHFQIGQEYAVPKYKCIQKQYDLQKRLN